MRRAFTKLAALSAILVCMASPLLTKAQEARSSGQTSSQRRAQDDLRESLLEQSGWEYGKCCNHAWEYIPGAAMVIPKKACRGTRWSQAVPGRCQAQPKASCYKSFGRTIVTVHEYTLTWNDDIKECRVAPTGEKENVEVDDCLGVECTD
jgi:hypothetical protein